MADTQVDGDQTDGTTQNANSGLSEGNGDKQLSFDAAKLQSTLDALASKVGELDARYKTLQGEKDKGVKHALNEVSDLRSQIAEYKELEKRLGSEGAMEQIEIKQTLAQMNQTLEQLQKGSASTQTTGTSASGAADTAKAFAGVFSEEELKDPRVAAGMAKQHKTVEEAELAAYRLQRQLASSPSPKDAQGAALQGKPSPSGDYDDLSSDELGAKLEALGRIDPRGSKEEREKIAAELERREKNK